MHTLSGLYKVNALLHHATQTDVEYVIVNEILRDLTCTQQHSWEQAVVLTELFCDFEQLYRPNQGRPEAIGALGNPIGRKKLGAPQPASLKGKNLSILS